MSSKHNDDIVESDSPSDESNQALSSSEEEMDTDSGEESSVDETQQTSTPFTLSFLQDEDKKPRQKTLRSFLQNKSHSNSTTNKTSLLLEKSTESIPSDFTPWWESFDHTKAKKNAHSKRLSEQEDHQSSNGLYNSWFDKSSASTDAQSWLCGPKPKTSTAESSTEVKDIEVPSIYGNITQPKGRRALKKERKEERNKTTGKKWFDMKLPDVDNKTKMDMEILQMRRALDPKKFFKQNDRKGLPKYFQLGTVVDEGTDFFSSRLTKKQRKQTLVEELMADAKVRQYNKKKYEEVQQKQRFKKFTKKSKTF